MADIPGFWKDAPDRDVPVEALWREYVKTAGGVLVDEHLPAPRTIENADFFFAEAAAVVELKEIETEFSHSEAFRKGFNALLERAAAENPGWRPPLLGRDGSVPNWFNWELLRLFRPPISRVLKKANRQIRETKQYLGVSKNTGILLLVNDGFTGIGPDFVQALASDLLVHSYSSIACCVYMTVNRHIEFPGDPEPKRVWTTSYAESAPNELVDFVDGLGRGWFDFLEMKYGPSTSRTEVPHPTNILAGTRAIRIPGERR